MGLHVRVAMVDIARPPGRFRYPTLYSPNGVYPICLADTTNTTMCGGIDVPQYRLSTAKVYTSLDISKCFRYIFRKIMITKKRQQTEIQTTNGRGRFHPTSKDAGFPAPNS